MARSPLKRRGIHPRTSLRGTVGCDAAIHLCFSDLAVRQVDRRRLRLRDDGPNDAAIQCALVAKDVL